MLKSSCELTCPSLLWSVKKNTNDFLVDEVVEASLIVSRMIPGTHNDMGPPKMVSGTHTIAISSGILMGIVMGNSNE